MSIDTVLSLFTGKEFAAAAALFGVISLPLSAYFYWASLERVQLSYNYEFFDLFNKNPILGPKLKYKVIFDDIEVERVIRHKYLVVNSGNRTIDKDELVGECRIEFSQKARILAATTLFLTDESSNFSINTVDNHVLFNWDFLRPKEGVIFFLYVAVADLTSPLMSGAKFVAATKRGRAARSSGASAVRWFALFSIISLIFVLDVYYEGVPKGAESEISLNYFAFLVFCFSWFIQLIIVFVFSLLKMLLSPNGWRQVKFLFYLRSKSR